MNPVLDRVRGCVFGLAIGDALGAALEFMSMKEIRQKYPAGLRDLVGGGWLDLPAGHFTDDTQMALCLSHSLIEKQGFDVEDVAKRYVFWMNSNPPDIGNTISKGLMNVKKGISPLRSGIGEPSESNGSVMRCAPLGIAYRNSEHLEDYSRIESAITHSAKNCINAYVVVNKIIAGLINGEKYDDFVKTIVSQPIHESFQSIVHNRDIIKEPSGYVIDTLKAVFYALNTNKDFESTIVSVVNLGGDSDTTGAIAGGIAGARYGFENIPERWKSRIQSYSELDDVSVKLYELSSKL